MATKKDLVEAHAFSRRRLVTAFISGAPGGREVEPSRPGRTIVGGIALSILLMAGAAIASVLSARTPADWQKEGVIVSQGGTTAMYVILDDQDPVLHPILNGTSAQLIFGADTEPTTVSRDTLDQQTPGSTLGIYGAPPDLPPSRSMIYSGWTACTGDGLGVRLDVDTTPDVESGAGYGFTVRTQATDATTAYYLVTVGADDGATTRARAFPVPDLPTSDSMLQDLGAPARAEAMTVPADWVRLFQPGGRLDFDSFGFDPTSGPLPAALSGVRGAKVGSFIEDPDGGGRVITPQGLLPLSPFALTVYRYSVLPGTSGPPPELVTEGTEAAIASTASTEQTEAPASWPSVPIARTRQARQACAVLSTVEGERPAVRLGIDPGESASAAGVTDPGGISRRVEPGHGSFYYVGAFDAASGGAPWVLNSQGIVYPVVDTESVELLRYDSLPAPVVPDVWNKLFEPGVALSTSAALCPPDPSGSAADQVCDRPGDGAPSPSTGTAVGVGSGG